MNTNRILVAGIVGGVFSFFLGWLIWGIIFKDSMPSGMASVARPEAEFIWWAMVLSNLLWGFLIAFIFDYWANISTWITGAKAGAILGFLIAASFDLAMFSMYNMFSMQEMIVDIVLNTVWSAIIGAVIGWWLGYRK